MIRVFKTPMSTVLPLLLTAAPAGATSFTLQDLTTTVRIETARSGTNPVGVVDWIVGGIQGGVDHMYEEGFWYRIGNDTNESSLHSLPIAFENAVDLNQNPGLDVLDVVYTGPGFTAEVRWSVLGSAAGCCSDIGEQVKITNTGNSPLSFTLFEYTNFDLNGNPFDEFASIYDLDEFKQRDGAILADTTLLPDATRWEISLNPTLKNSLDDNAITNLLNATSPLTGGDLVWAAQWDFNIAAGRSVIVSKDKLVSAVPLPAPALLLLGGLACMGVLSRRRLNMA